MRPKIVLPLATTVTALAGVALAGPASAHGYISSPPSRQALCASGAVTGCGPIQYEPQSVEAPKGSKKCSGGNANFTVLDDESRDWPATDVGGDVTFNWTLTARHSTSTWVYYVDGQQVASFDDQGAKPNATVSHDVDLSDYSGEHTVLAVWNIADTVNAFYNCVDVNIGGSGGGSNGPTPTPDETTTAPSGGGTQAPAPTASSAPTATATTEPAETGAPADGAEWKDWTWYDRGDTVTYEGVTYECRQSHTTLPGWEPSAVLALWLPK
ncbi:lytic polysaccharide monooxygenase [Kineosporia sp. NBRC 101731]|uniref:lytic polysaccharide monooxygenase n=1 Tax=Kineosporia sp. NBRC 101731 TaxID=3032199 RepID=UPI0024A55D0A|nr:lytic polysaccharide monooxygenase [Kineosporia sp. NBRC 101731]GLY33226.1 cellulose-binding protein [Kineosporia sp. NBRC 101731]